MWPSSKNMNFQNNPSSTTSHLLPHMPCFHRDNKEQRWWYILCMLFSGKPRLLKAPGTRLHVSLIQSSQWELCGPLGIEVRAGFEVFPSLLSRPGKVSGPLFSGPVNGNNGRCLQLLQNSNVFLVPECWLERGKSHCHCDDLSAHQNPWS